MIASATSYYAVDIREDAFEDTDEILSEVDRIIYELAADCARIRTGQTVNVTIERCDVAAVRALVLGRLAEVKV